MTQPGRASIEIVGDVSKLGRQLKRDAQRAVDNIDLDTDKLAGEIGQGFEKGAAAAVHAVEAAVPKITSALSSITDAASDAAGNIEGGFGSIAGAITGAFKKVGSVVGGFFQNIGEKAVAIAQAIRSRFVEPLQEGLSRVGSLLSSLGTALGGLVLEINPAALATFAAYIAAFTVLIPLVIGLGAALVDLAGFATLLPGVLASAAGAMIVATIAFQGFGDALSAIMDGDPEKITEALKELAPAARAVAREFQEILPGLRQVGDMIQQQFFTPLIGQLDQFGTRTLPLLRDELGGLSRALGTALDRLATMAQSSKNVEILGRSLDVTSVTTDKLGQAFTKLGDALFEALDASLPTLEELGGELAGVITQFANWLSTSVKDGSFQEFLDDAIATLKELWDLGGALGDLFGVLFSGTDDAGRGFIGTLTDVTKRLTEFFKSAEGQDAIGDFVELIEFAGFVIGQVVSGFRNLVYVFSLVDNAVKATGDFFADLWHDITEAWDAITTATGDAVSAVGTFFSDLWTDITEIWDSIVSTIGDAIDSVVVFFQELPGKILGFIESIPGKVSAVFNAMIDQAISIFAAGLAAIIVFFTDGPRQVAGAFQWLLDQVISIWNSIITTISNAVTEIGEWWDSLPGKLAALGESIKTWATDTWNTVKDTVVNALSALLDFISGIPKKIGDYFTQTRDAASNRLTELVERVKGIPGRVLSALGDFGTLLYNSGKKVIQGLINGISDKIGDLKRKVAEAVSAIRDHLPFSPAKIGPLSGSGSPDIAGAKIAEMIAAGLDSGQPLILGAAGRAAGAVADAGVNPLMSSTPGAPSVMSPTSVSVATQPIFLVQIGDEQIEAVVSQIADERIAIEVRRLLAGTRGV